MITIEGGRPGLKLTAYRLSLPESTRDAVGAAALTMKRTITAGAPTRLRGAGKKGARLGVQYKVEGLADASAFIRATGPWQLIESDTKAHLIVSKKLGGTRKRRTSLAGGLFVAAPGKRITTTRSGVRGAILTPNGPRAYARHPGTKGQHPWKNGVERGEPKAVAAYAQKIQADFRKQFI